MVFILPPSSGGKAHPDCVRGSALGATLEMRCEDRSFGADAGANHVQEDGLEEEGSIELQVADSCQLRSTCNVFAYLAIY